VVARASSGGTPCGARRSTPASTATVTTPATTPVDNTRAPDRIPPL
jgi:hypothetical protein